MADATNQVVKISGEIVLGSDPFANAPILTAIGAGVKTAQDAIQGSSDSTKNFSFSVSVEAQKPPRKTRTPAAAAAAQSAGGKGQQAQPAAA